MLRRNNYPLAKAIAILLAIIFIAFIESGCGGGGGDDNNVNTHTGAGGNSVPLEEEHPEFNTFEEAEEAFLDSLDFRGTTQITDPDIEKQEEYVTIGTSVNCNHVTLKYKGAEFFNDRGYAILVVQYDMPDIDEGSLIRVDIVNETINKMMFFFQGEYVGEVNLDGIDSFGGAFGYFRDGVVILEMYNNNGNGETYYFVIDVKDLLVYYFYTPAAE